MVRVGVAQKIVYQAASARVQEKAGKPALEVFEKAMNNIMPVLEVKARRIGGATCSRCSIEVRADRRQALGLRWLTMFSRKRGEKTMEERLANEILDASNNTGASVKRGEKKTFIRWLKRTRHSLITDSNRICNAEERCSCFWLIQLGGKTFGWKRISLRENQKYRYYGSHRCW